MTYSLDALKPLNSPDRQASGGIKRFAHEVCLIFSLLALVFWLLALLSFSNQDAAWSTSGATQSVARNWGGKLGAYLADLSYFSFGFSVWWLLAVGFSVWLASLARWLRGDVGPHAATSHATGALTSGRILFWLSLLALLMASAGLEWTRMYRFEARLPDHAGGALG